MYGRMSRSLFNAGKTLHKTQVCRCKTINNEYSLRKRTISLCKQNYLNKKVTEDENLDESDDDYNLPSSLIGKFKVFRDDDSPVIFDVNEERKRINLEELKIEEEEDPYIGLNLTRGVTGVFEIEDLVEVLERDNARQLFVAMVPKEYSYVDYIVVVTGRSPKHMLALATFIRKLFKLKCNNKDKIPKIEGKKSKEWIAIDLGNIALHIFSYEARHKYDLETLWSVGSEFDDITNTKEEAVDIMDKYKSFLKELLPAE